MVGQVNKTIGLAALALLPAFAMTAAPAAATPRGQNGKIVFSCPATPNPNGGTSSAICVINPDGTGRVRILDGNGQHPVWSPDGTKIAFTSNRNSTQAFLDVPQSDIWVMNADGSNPVQLTFTSTDGRPAWSADGRIAFTSFRDHITDASFHSSIYVMNADGSNQHAVTTVDTASFDDQPAWSPDGKRIAFVRFGIIGSGGSVDFALQEIYAINDDGTGFTSLTISGGINGVNGVSKNSPTWSPDGTQVVFTETPLDATLAAYIVGAVNADGSNEHFVTTNSDVLPNGPNVDVMTVTWAPDGSTLLGSCSFSQPTTTPGRHLCFIDPGTGSISAALDTAGFAFDGDWARAPLSSDLILTTCNDPALGQLTTVAGSFIVSGLTGCTSIDAGQLVSVGSNVTFDGTGSTAINLGNLTNVGANLTFDGVGTADINLGSLTVVGANLTFDGVGSTSINLANVVTVGANLTFNGVGSADINLGSVQTIGGNLQFTNDGSVRTVSIPELTRVGGNVVVADNPLLTSILLPRLETVGGNLSIKGLLPTIELAGTTVQGDETLVGNGTTFVSARTAVGQTDVTLLGGVAPMRVVIPDGAFEQPVAFTIQPLGDLQPEPGSSPTGAAVIIQPIGGYAFSFAIPTLNADAQLAFRIDLAQLDPDTRAAVLAGAQDGSATIAVKGDAAGSSYTAFATCTGAQTPQTNGCVAVSLIGADGTTLTDPAQAAFVNLAGVAGHFSTWSVVLMKPLPDVTPPTVTIALTAPNGGVPDGQHGWFITGPVTGVVQAVKTSGWSAITSLTCGSVALQVAGLGTQSVAGTFAITTDGLMHLACTASDGAGNTSAPATLDVKLDRTPPTLAPTVAPSQVTLNGIATAAPNANDTVSGLAAASCGAVTTSTAGPHTVTCTATDNAGNVATAPAAYTVVAPLNVCLGEPAHQVLAPIAADGSSVFVRGLPIPVRFRLCDGAGRSISSKIISSFRLVGTITGAVAQNVNLPVRSAFPEVGFFWDPLLREWDFVLATDVLKAGTTYVYDIALTDGSHIGFRFALKVAR